MKITLTIAGSDSSGGAGIQADIKSMSANNTFAMSVITLVTSQNSKKISAFQYMEPKIIINQANAVFDDYEIAAIKIGAIGNLNTACAVLAILKTHKLENIVVDPVMISKSGSNLIDEEAIPVVEEIFKYAKIITPNLEEAQKILNTKIKSIKEREESIKTMFNKYNTAILLKGGHDTSDKVVDLFYDGNEIVYIENKRIDTKNTHGTGCSLSSAITSNLANGMPLLDSVKKGISYVQNAIKNGFDFGANAGPLNHFKDFKNEW